jgi:hypothetical protein
MARASSRALDPRRSRLQSRAGPDRGAQHRVTAGNEAVEARFQLPALEQDVPLATLAAQPDVRAEAISVDGIRVTTGVVVAGAPGALSVENHAIGDAFEIRAIGSPQILTGTLTRTGGVVAQIGATYPDAQLTVTPADALTLPATDRSLVPTNGKPRL